MAQSTDLRSLWWQVAGSELLTFPVITDPQTPETEPVQTITLTLAKHPGARTITFLNLSPSLVNKWG